MNQEVSWRFYEWDFECGTHWRAVGANDVIFPSVKEDGSVVFRAITCWDDPSSESLYKDFRSLDQAKDWILSPNKGWHFQVLETQR